MTDCNSVNKTQQELTKAAHIKPGSTGVIMIPAPVCTIEVYAERTGQQLGVVRGHVERGYVPTVKHGKYRLVNLAALAVECMESSSSDQH